MIEGENVAQMASCLIITTGKLCKMNYYGGWDDNVKTNGNKVIEDLGAEM